MQLSSLNFMVFLAAGCTAVLRQINGNLLLVSIVTVSKHRFNKILQQSYEICTFTGIHFFLDLGCCDDNLKNLKNW